MGHKFCSRRRWKDSFLAMPAQLIDIAASLGTHIVPDTPHSKQRAAGCDNDSTRFLQQRSHTPRINPILFVRFVREGVCTTPGSALMQLLQGI